MSCINKIFPTGDLLPKVRTGAESFLKKFPSYDGRNVVICILDTGVDPGASGLQITSDGKPKIIDLVDTTGCGDVILNKVVDAKSVDDSGIVGVSGRTLYIPKAWCSSTSEFRLGAKSSYELFPDSLTSRLSKEYREKKWDPAFRAAIGSAHSIKACHEKNVPSSVEETLEKDNYLAHEECLTTIDKKFSYNGELYDVISFFNEDEKTYYACIDKTMNGDLSNAKLMRAYREAQEYDRLDDLSLMNYSFRFHEEGKRLEIVTTGTSHGTHVASIAAAYFPDDPGKNGVAPGAQVIGVKIGDNRLKGMETGTALMRACTYIAGSETDLVNYSFGEACHMPNYGKVCSEISKLVYKHNIIFCSSSGNHGPGLGTVGVPGGTQDCIVGVAPVVYPEMMEVEYSLPCPVQGGVYTWASRGPTADGLFGVDLSAPGAAITSVPNWTLKNGQLMNGSSMSSPNASGCFGLLLSALKQENIEYNAFSVARAFLNTAEMMENFSPLDQGRGCIMVDRAWEYYNQHPIDISDNFRFVVRVNSSNRGIYVREWDTLRHPKLFTVSITPEAKESMKVEDRVELELKLTLTCEASWVTIPHFLLLNNSVRSISIRVDPSHLKENSLNIAEIRAYDTAKIKKGPLFTIPVIAIVPVQSSGDRMSFHHVFKQGDIQRNFIQVPVGASGCRIRLRCLSYELQACRLALHCLQAMPHEYYKSHELHRYLNVGEAWEEYSFPVVEGRTLEVCLARWWSMRGDSDLEWTVEFSGLKPMVDQVTILPGEHYHKVNVMSHFAKEEMSPSAQITNLVLPIRPSSCEACPTCELDINCDKEIQFSSKFSYSFNLTKASEIFPSFPFLNDVLYESDYTNQMWHLYDSNKRLINAGDYKTSNSFKVDKGDYTLFLLLKNENQGQLDRLKDMTMLLYMKQPNHIPLEFFGSLPYMSSNKKMSSSALPKGSVKSIFVTMPADDKIPKHATPGSFLVGHIAFHKSDEWKKVINYPLKLVIGEQAKKSARKGKSQGSDDDKITGLSDISNSIRSLKIAALQKLKEKEDLEKLYDELCIEFGKDDLEVCYGRLLSIDHLKCSSENLQLLVNLCNVLINGYANDDLAHYSVNKAETYDTKHSTAMEKQKSQLIDALCRTAHALSLFIQKCYTDGTEESDECKDYIKELDKVYCTMKKWSDMKDSKATQFQIEFYCAKQLWACALKLLLKTNEEKPTKENEMRILEIMKKKLCWIDLASMYETQMCLRYPHDYKPW